MEVFTMEKTQRNSQFDGGVLGLIGINILVFLICFFTLFIGTTWAMCVAERWKASHTVIDGKRLVFEGTGAGLLGKSFLWFLLFFITVGIYGLWIPIKMSQWKTEHTHFEE